MIHRYRQLAGRNRVRKGFTLIEAAMTTAVIGFGVVGMLQLLAAGTVANSEGTELTTAVNLANNVREISLGLAFRDPEQPTVWTAREAGALYYDNITDLDNMTFQPPLDVRRRPITGYGTWSQRVKVETVASDNLTSLRPDDINEPAVRVTVTVTRNNVAVHEANWLVLAPNTSP